MFLPTIYARGSETSILSQLISIRQNSSKKMKNLLNLLETDCKFDPSGNDAFIYDEKEVLFVFNHGGGLPTVLFEPKPVINNQFSGGKRLTLETYLRLIQSSFSLKLYENKILLLAVCFAAKKPTFGNNILAVELAKKLKISVLAADSIVNVRSRSGSEYKFQNGGYLSKKSTYIIDIATYGNWNLIDQQGKIKVLQTPRKIGNTKFLNGSNNIS